MHDATHRWIGVLLACCLVAVAAPGLAQNAEQSGSFPDCLDFNVFWVNHRVQAAGVTGQRVEIDAGTWFELSSDRGTPYVDFYDEQGNFIKYETGPGGTVPAQADHGTVCVGATGVEVFATHWPDVPLIDASWTYQDGFAENPS